MLVILLIIADEGKQSISALPIVIGAVGALVLILIMTLLVVITLKCACKCFLEGVSKSQADDSGKWINTKSVY